MPAASINRAYQNRLPADYIAKTLRRLLPSKDLNLLSRDELIDFAALQRKLSHLIKSDPSRFFLPNPGGQRAFLTHWDQDSSKTVLLFLAGNKTGKTTGGALLMGERLWGQPLWDRKNRSNVLWPTPSVGIVFTEDFESHRDTILPTIRTWWPKHIIRRISYGVNNAPTELILENDSILKFKTYAQGADTAEGKDWHQVWFDEPPSHSIYTAAFRGIVATGGRMYVTATLLKEPWLFDEQEQNYAQFFASEIHDNKWISETAKTAFLSSLSEEEREVRESGKPFSLTGLIYKYFADKEPYVIEPFELPEKWPYFIGVDPHERRPVHVGYFTITPQNQLIMIDYRLVRGDTETILRQIREYEKTIGIPSPIRLCIMDPNRGKAQQINQISWEQVFSEGGYDVVLGNDDLNIGHAEMYKWLRIEEKTHCPRLMFTTNCRGKFGPIYQMQRYAWDDWANHSSRVEKDVKEKPKQFNKDFPDICRYVVMENLEYDKLLYGHQVIQTSPGMIPYGRVTMPGEDYIIRPYGRIH